MHSYSKSRRQSSSATDESNGTKNESKNNGSTSSRRSYNEERKTPTKSPLKSSMKHSHSEYSTSNVHKTAHLRDNKNIRLNQVTTTISGKVYSHLQTLDIFDTCKHLPVNDKRTQLGVTSVGNFIFYHDRDLYPQPSDPKIEELVSVLKNLNKDFNLDGSDKVEYVLHLVEPYELSFENHREITSSSVLWYGGSYLKYAAADSSSSCLASKRSHKSVANKKGTPNTSPGWQIDGWIKSQNKSERMTRSLTSPELALSLIDSTAEKLENTKLDVSEDLTIQTSIIEEVSEYLSCEESSEESENKEESIPVETQLDKASTSTETKLPETKEISDKETTDQKLDASSNNNKSSAEIDSSAPKKIERATPRQNLLIKNLLSQAGIFKNAEKVSTFEERHKEREKLREMNEKLHEKKQLSQPVRQTIIVQSSKSKSKKPEKQRRSNSSESLNKTTPLECKTTDSIKPRFPMLEKFLDKKNGKDSGLADNKSLSTALDLSVSLPQYKKFQQGDIDCCTYSDMSNQKFYVKDDLKRFFEKKALKWKSYHKNLIDTHCHFDMLFNKIRYRKTVADYFKEFGSIYLDNFEACVNIICDPSKFPSHYQLQEFLKKLAHPKVFSAIGCHPHFANKWDDKIRNLVYETLSKPGIVAIGECGLDYSRKNNVPMDIQRRTFKAQLEIAYETNKPIVIHCRDMETEVFEIMKEFLDSKHRIHLHCFTGGWAIGKVYLDYFENLCIGVTPLLTYNSKEVKDLIQNVPLNRLLLETDAPYFVPQTIEFPLGIGASHPAFIFATVESVANMRKIEVNDLLDLNRTNVKRVYGF